MLNGKSGNFLLVLAVVVLLPALAVADYPAEVPRTGQTRCYDSVGASINCEDTGQDGDLQAGAAWPGLRFTVNEGAVTDTLTGLVWTRDANLMITRDPSISSNGRVTWQNALDYVAKLNSESYLGYTDWRLPNIRELHSLVDYSQYRPPLLEGYPFNNIDDDYWSSTSYEYNTRDTHAAWLLDMFYGDIYYNSKSLSFYVWPVRGGQCGIDNSIICLPKTGQSSCYDAEGVLIDCAGTGQDGNLQAGVAWPEPRFTVNEDTVTDALTGLVWAQDANLMATRDPTFDEDRETGEFVDDGAVTWQHALDYVAKLNSESYLGYTDWRLPNIRELHSLIDYSQYWPSLLEGYPFNNVKFDNYWSSTSWAFAGRNACDVDMSYGEVFGMYSAKSYTLYVWPVRAGKLGDESSSTSTTASSDCTTTTTATGDTTTTVGGDTTTTTTTGGYEPCPATQVLGADNPQLDDLRDFRDGTLARSAVGQCIISLYYGNAPATNAALERSPFLKAIARRVLDAAALAVGP